MNKNNLWILCLFLAGCIAVASAPRVSPGKWKRPLIALTDIDRVQVGMTFTEVAVIMGNTVSIGYREDAGEKGIYEEILVKNPYDTEILTVDGRSYRIAFYYTHIRKADGIITEDELTPLVFEGEKLVGKGEKYLNELISRLK